jgi:acyl-CoA reductase-like NAD-dependent aldehyde dehydrogenase
MDKDLASVQQARDLVEAAHHAWATVARFDQAKIDRICEAMAQAGLREAERLGQLAVEETGFGVAADKATKNRFAAGDVWNFFRPMKTVGVVNDNGDVVEIASPRGVVAAIIPTTNPTSTALFKCIIAIKSRNTVVLSPHPSATRCIHESARVVRDAAVKEGLPPEAIGCLDPATLDATDALMKHKRTAVILATGGLGLVRAAYSSGKPAFGVGPGNVPVFVERTADAAKAVQDILTGTCFDNGTICASEQSVVVDAPIAAAVREQFKLQGAYFLPPSDADKVAQVLATPQRTLNPKIVGRSAQQIADLAGVTIPPGTRCLLADCGGVGRDYVWSIEKLSPSLAFFVVDGLEAGAQRCLEVLQFGGLGHTAGMHTRSRDAAIAYGAQMPAARVIINSPTTHGAIGFSTALEPSMTLGCGSWGGNVTSDNISPLHLMDIKRVAFETKPVNASRAVTPAVAPPAPKPVINRQEIAAIVDKFLAQRPPDAPAPTATVKQIAPVEPSDNGKKPSPVAFVCEDDVRRAVAAKEKIYINAKTIITPAARDLGEAGEVFAKS